MSNWKNVAERMRSRRLDLGLTMKEAAHIAGISEPQWDVMENARRDTFRTRSLRGVERALKWHPGAIDALLAGVAIHEEPPVRDEADIGAAVPMRDPILSGFSPTDRELLKRIIGDLVESELFGGSPLTWRIPALRKMYELDRPTFMAWVATELMGVYDDPLPSEPHDPADFLEHAAQVDEDGVLDGRTETPVEETPEV